MLCDRSVYFVAIIMLLYFFLGDFSAEELW